MKEAIIFIPGSTKNQRGKALDVLLEGLTYCSDIAHIGEASDIAIKGHQGKSVGATFFNGEEKIVDLYEAYWNDLTYPLEEGNAIKKFFKATGVLHFWFFSKVWLAIFKSSRLIVSSLFTILVLLFWYIGILLIALAALQHETSLNSIEFLKPTITWLANIGGKGETLSIWLALSLLMSFFPVEAIIGSIYFTKEYLQRDLIKHTSRKRVLNLVHEVFKSNQYEQVTLVAYSFGVVVATDFVSNYQNGNPGKKIRLLTLGGPLELLINQSDWLKEEVKSCHNNPLISEWLDFYSDKDWLATSVPEIKETTLIKPHSIRINTAVSIGSRLSGKVHEVYFHSSEVMNNVLKSQIVEHQLVGI